MRFHWFMRVVAVFSFACPPVLAEDEKAPEWEVNAEHGQVKTVAFTTDEGTWMSLDVSPDGKEIVLDLLGDLYLLPIGGGKAKLLVGDPAMDLQPRFSPDGKRISFTSDRGGGDNIWVVNRDGSGLRAVTDEDFRLLNNAVWTPDGQYLIARKHFTSTRSLGAGEMWLYHLSGGKGVQLTKRKNDQQDAGEPSISPDGRYLYFSEDMSGGSTFQYNKDPNGQIYVIRRLDRETGELETLIRGNGGSARPQPSPDGRGIAFVRRVRTDTVLYYYDIDTGAQTPLFDGMSHDQQEAWAIFGVYPNFAWTPDSKAIVFWAKGHLHKLDVAQKSLTQIPFEVDVEKTVSVPVTSKRKAWTEDFEAKMIRDAATSPDGNHLVFHAVGFLWKKRLPDGKPERLTKDTHYEYEPAFSPDGKSVVYTTWSDERHGAIYRVSLQGGQAKKLTPRPGFYDAPGYSPDGARIVYRRGTGNRMLGYVHGVEPGLYWMPAEGGDGRFIREDGREPRFDATGERIFFLQGFGLEKEYRSVRLDGGEERTHFNLKYVNRVIPSPDNRWVAFTELYNVYLAAFPETGSPIELNKDSKALPMARVTRDAGLYVHWSGDGQKLHWTTGPEYFTRSLNDCFSFLEGAPETLPEPEAQGQPVGLTLPADIPKGTLALVGGRILTMEGDRVLENGTVIVERNRIVAVGEKDGVEVPSGAAVIDLEGKTVMPGIVDVHAHNNHFMSGPSPQENWSYIVNLAYGVTTAHDPSANTETVFSQSELVKAGLMRGPRIFSTGTILYGADGDFKAVVDSLDDARSHIRRMKAVGAFSVKSYNQPRRDQRQQILQAAREEDMLVVLEGGSTFVHNLSMILDGSTGVEHNLPVAPLHRDVVQLWGQNPVGYTPTLVVSFGGISGEYYWYQHTDIWKKERLLRFHPRAPIDARSRRRQMLPENDFHHIEVARSCKAVNDAGVKVNIGAHGQLQGLAAHWEIWMLAQGGMTPMEALRSATLNGAEYLGMGDDLGSVTAGKLADLVVLDGNPLEDIRQTESVRYVVANGRIYDAETMNEVGNRPRALGTFYWQREGGGEDTDLTQSEGYGQCSCRGAH